MLRYAELVLLVVAVAQATDPESYDGYRLVSASVSEPHQLAVVRSLATGRRDLGVDVLGVDADDAEGAAGHRAELMVPPHAIDDVLLLLNTTRVPHRVRWPDVQRVLDDEAARRGANPRDVGPGGEFTDQRFMRYEEVEQYLRRLAAEHPDLVTLQSMGRTHEGRSLTGVLVSRGPGSRQPAGPRRAILIDAGFHAREWIAPAVALYVVNQLVETDRHRHLLDGLDWYVFPLLNPDGYEYSHTHSRFWRKNRSNGSDLYCRGVDLNRNFGFHWAQNGASHAPCDITFAGPRAFSELETQQFRDYVLDKQQGKVINTYLTLHSYGRLILHPWGFTDEPVPDAARLDAIGQEANRAMVAAGSKPYRVGSPPSLLYPAAGGSDDWAKGEAGIETVYTIELPGGGPNGFDIGREKIAKTVRHVFEGIKVFAKYAAGL